MLHTIWNGLITLASWLAAAAGVVMLLAIIGLVLMDVFNPFGGRPFFRRRRR